MEAVVREERMSVIKDDLEYFHSFDCVAELVHFHPKGRWHEIDTRLVSPLLCIPRSSWTCTRNAKGGARIRGSNSRGQVSLVERDGLPPVLLLAKTTSMRKGKDQVLYWVRMSKDCLPKFPSVQSPHQSYNTNA